MSIKITSFIYIEYKVIKEHSSDLHNKKKIHSYTNNVLKIEDNKTFMFEMKIHKRWKVTENQDYKDYNQDYQDYKSYLNKIKKHNIWQKSQKKEATTGQEIGNWTIIPSWEYTCSKIFSNSRYIIVYIHRMTVVTIITMKTSEGKWLR